MKILTLTGSQRKNSFSNKLLEEIKDKENIITYDNIDKLPIYNKDLDDTNSSKEVKDFREVLSQADGLLIISPEYNGSIPGGLKNALDWASRPFPNNQVRNKPALAIGISQGMFGGAWAQNDLKRVLSTIGARVIDKDLTVRHIQDKENILEEHPEIIDSLKELKEEVNKREMITLPPEEGSLYDHS